MKKNLRTYGVLIIYLTILKGLDFYLGLDPKTNNPSNHIAVAAVYLNLRNWIWLLSSTLSFLYVWYCIYYKFGDKIFHFIQILLGSLVIISIFTHLTAWYPKPFSQVFPFNWIWWNLIGKGSGGLIELYVFMSIFITGLGVTGLLRKNGNDATVS